MNPIPWRIQILRLVMAGACSFPGLADSGSPRVSAQELPGPDSTQHREVRQLIARLLPEQAKFFSVEFIPAESGRDVFEVESRDGRIVLRGNKGISIAAGLNWYLKYECNAHYSLKGRQLAIPKSLPVVQDKVRRVSQDRWRYFLNYCCFGYSLPWYDWADWERLIDWMALQGINAPLSVTGQEAVWREAGRRLGFSEGDLKDFLAGPPYLPFGWMGCLDGWGGPLPQSWVD
ncbi:MAG TPA: alpha-N-acetylglucosaminidase TIM-barrel domain-containing protein, partial [Candidatus Paceibacterota bacterium]|nr:alpha-N-acetylglucosaminidase TIM-barrel domain-containing protein [Candidatus Paceibacterota bacterium]